MLCQTSRVGIAQPRAITVAVVFFLSCLGLLCGVGPVRGGNRTDTVQIGIVGTLFRDIPQPLIQASFGPFRMLMEAQTGLKGDVTTVANPDKLAEQLATEHVHLGVFHGFEFAWARQKYPRLVPLVIVVNQQRHLHAHVLVRRDCQATVWTTLRNKTLALYRSCPAHCRLFVERQCQTGGAEPAGFFMQMTTPASGEDALDDVVDGVVQAAVVDGVCLQSYERRKPGRFAKLKELQKSEVFPAAVVAYRPGTIDETVLQRFRDGMLTAGENARGRLLLNLWRITAFEKVPEDYEQTLIEIARAYPRPQPPEVAGATPTAKLTKPDLP